MKKLLMSAVGVAACAAAFAAEETCKDGICPLPASPAEAEFAVLSPVPETAVGTVKQGPRLKSLEGSPSSEEASWRPSRTANSRTSF